MLGLLITFKLLLLYDERETIQTIHMSLDIYIS